MKKLLRFAPWVAALLISCFGSYFIARAVAPSGPTTFQALRLIPGGQPFGLSLENPIGHALQILDPKGNPFGIVISTAYQGDACAQINAALAAAAAIGGSSTISPPLVLAYYPNAIQNCTTPLTYTGTVPFHLFLNGYFKLPASANGGFYIPANAELEGSSIEGLTPTAYAGTPLLSGAVFDYEPTTGSTPIINFAGSSNSAADFFSLRRIHFVGNANVTNGLWVSTNSTEYAHISDIVCSASSASSQPTGQCIYITNDQTTGGAFDRLTVERINASGNGWAGGAFELDATYGGSENSTFKTIECIGPLNAPCFTLINANGPRIKDIGSASTIASNIAVIDIVNSTNVEIGPLTFDNGNCSVPAGTGTSELYLSGVQNATISNSLFQSGTGCTTNVSSAFASGGNNLAINFVNNTFSSAFPSALTLSSTDSSIAAYRNRFETGVTNAVVGAAQLAVPDTLSCDIPDNAALNSTWCTSIVNATPHVLIDGLDITYNGTCTTYPAVQMYSSALGALTGAAVTGTAGFNSSSLTTLLQSQVISSGTVSFKVPTAPAGCGSSLGTTHFHVIAHLVR